VFGGSCVRSRGVSRPPRGVETRPPEEVLPSLQRDLLIDFAEIAALQQAGAWGAAGRISYCHTSLTDMIRSHPYEAVRAAPAQVVWNILVSLLDHLSQLLALLNHKASTVSPCYPFCHSRYFLAAPTRYAVQDD